jgi:gliding motility-associated-like protein
MSRLPATGTWTLTRYPGASTSSGNGTNGTVTGIAHGTYNFTVTNEFGCVSTPTANIVMPAQPPLPSAPVIGDITQPVYEEPTGSIELEGLPSGSWKITQLPEPDHLIIDGSGTSYKISGLAGGAYSYTVTNSYGCTSEESVEVLISTLGKPDLVITDPPAVCFPATVDITLPSVTDGSTRGLTYTFWTNAEATQELSNPSAASAGTYYIKGTTVSGYFNIKPVIIKVYQRPVANAGTDQVLVLKSATNLSAELGEGETGFWSVDQGEGLFADSIDPKTAIDNLATGRNVLLWVVTNNVCPADTDKVNILVGDIIAPTLITPNGDTKNEYFVILGLESIGKSELVIFDRRGSEVFRNSDYDNKWNGVDYNENPLPNDTYFYSLKTIKGRTYSGYIIIRR